jgi:hypothetical protein
MSSRNAFRCLVVAASVLFFTGSNAWAQTRAPSVATPGPRPSVLFAHGADRRDSTSPDSTSGHSHPALTGAIIGGTVVGTAVVIAGLQFCDETGGSHCGNPLGIVGGFAMGAVVGAVLGGLIGSAFGN